VRPRSLTAHRSKRRLAAAFCALGAGVAATSACHKDPVVTTRTVTTWVPQACAVDGSGYAEYYALGDFDPPAPPQKGHLLSAVGEALPEIDAQARALVVTAGESGRTWEGVGPVPAQGDVSVLVTPALASCPLTTTVGARTGSAMAPIGAQRVMIVGGQNGTQNPTTYVARLDTGEVDTVFPELPTPRTDASVTAFGDGALVAGGINVDDGTVIDKAVVYSASTGGFDQEHQVQLDEPRAKHGAVVLASGQTLLVGGVGGTDGKTVLASLETVDPVTLAVNEAGLQRLATPRYGATVLRLADGAILVAGGFDSNDQPVQQLEWFAKDGTQSTTHPQTLVQGPARAFVALEGGGALAVLAPWPGAPSSFQNTWLIDARGVPQAVTPVPTPAPGSLTSPVLFGGAGGAPLLWTGNRWLQWQPYAGAFGAVDVLDDVPATIGDATCSPDPGVAMWLDPSQSALTLLRFDTRNAYSALPGPLFVTDTAETAPDRLAGVSFRSDTGLVLDAGSPGAAAFVTDRTYADVAIDVNAPGGAASAGDQPVYVVLRDDRGSELDVPGASCGSGLAAGPLHVERRGAAVSWSIAGGSTGSCTPALAAGARVSVGVRASSSAQGVVHNFAVIRLGEP
jgi:hypothetical protein